MKRVACLTPLRRTGSSGRRAFRFASRAAALIAAVTFAACDSATAADPMSLDGLPQLTAVEELRIGSADDPDFGFSRVYSVDVDRDGRIYAGESVDREIRVYSPDGTTLLHRIGGPGEGPGEFMTAPRFGVVGDTVWTYDVFNGRLALFDRDGTLLSTGHTLGVRIPLWSGYGWVMPRAMLPGGVFISELMRVGGSRNDPETPVQPTDTVSVPRVLFDATGAVIDTVGWDPSPPPRMARPPGTYTSQGQVLTLSSGRYIVPTPPTELDLWEPLEDGRIILDMELPTTPDDVVFRITRLTLARDTVYQRELPYRPQSYTPEELDSIAMREARGGQLLSASGTERSEADIRVAANELRAKMSFPELKPAIRFYHLGQDEALWLLRTGETGPARWVVLDTDGIPRGELELPSNVRPAWSRGDVFWAIEPDEFDVPWLVRYRLTRG